MEPIKLTVLLMPDGTTAAAYPVREVEAWCKKHDVAMMVALKHPTDPDLQTPIVVSNEGVRRG